MVALERATESELRIVADAARYFGKRRIRVEQQGRGEAHSAIAEIAHRRRSHGFGETSREHRSGKSDGARQQRHRPALLDVFVQQPQGTLDLPVPERSMLETDAEGGGVRPARPGLARRGVELGLHVIAATRRATGIRSSKSLSAAHRNAAYWRYLKMLTAPAPGRCSP
jgi:hypothetical protein